MGRFQGSGTAHAPSSFWRAVDWLYDNLSPEELVLARIREVITPPAKLHAPLIGDREREVVLDCIKNGDVCHGPHVEIFESKIAARTKSRHVIAVSSGTAALHLALKAIGIKHGDSVVVPAFTFVATANAVTYCGATTEFVDCDEHGGLDPDRLDAWLESHRVKAVVCVHAFGHCCDMDSLVSVCNRHNVPLIEDAAQALGSYYDSRHAGTFGLLGAFSFNGNKIVTTGGGGAVVTDDSGLAQKVRELANVSKIEVPHEFWHADVGYNYRMPNLNAALGCAQFESLYRILNDKKMLAIFYERAFEDCGLACPLRPAPKRQTNHWLNALVLNGVDRKRLARLLDDNGIECRLCWTPLNLLPMYRNFPRDDLENTMRLASSIINVPSGPGLA